MTMNLDAEAVHAPTTGSIEMALDFLGAGLLMCCKRTGLQRPGPLWRGCHAGLACLAVIVASACSTGPSVAPGQTQTPRAYVDDALDWIQEHALERTGIDWVALRREAVALMPDPRTSADTYPTIRLALQKLEDPSAFFLEPGDFSNFTGLGITALYPQGTVVFVERGSPAARQGVLEGDSLEMINGEPLTPQGGRLPERTTGTWFVDIPKAPVFRLKLKRAGEGEPIVLDVPKTEARYDGEPRARRILHGGSAIHSVGYVELPWDGGWGNYPTRAQRAISAVDTPETCGWVVDLRRIIGGDYWTYLAAIGPILGEGDPGGFVFPNGDREGWAYRNGKVWWDGREQGESYLADPVYTLKRQGPPVAVLTSGATFDAGELVRVAFEGRPRTRSFGELTAGRPVLMLHTPLSDGAHISVGAAYAFDRNNQVYSGPISPDETIAMNWASLGTDQDPVLGAAIAWLRAQPECGD